MEYVIYRIMTANKNVEKKLRDYTEIPDNLVTFSSVISVYTFPFFSN